LQSSFLRNENLEWQFLGCSIAHIQVNLLDLESVDISVDTVASLLLSESGLIENEDGFL
jgi:hypothetical protein